MSKGSSPRPFSISQKEYESNYDRIFRKPSPKEIEDAKIEDEDFEWVERLLNSGSRTEVKDSSQGG
jgi:hypothetical protein